MQIIKKYLFLVFLSILATGLLFGQDTLSGSSLWYGFEAVNSWSTSDWENNAFSGEKTSGDFVTEGKKSLEVKANFKKAGQLGMVQVFDTGDMSGAEKIAFDIYNSSASNMKVFLMLKTGQNWVYHESTRIELKPGWNKGVTFNIKSNDYGSDGQYGKAIKEAGMVRRFGLGFDAASAVQGLVFIDNIRLSGAGIEKLLPSATEQGKDEGTEVLIDSFEGARLKWSAAGTWSCAVAVENTTETASAGKGAMKAIYELKEPGVNAVFNLEDTVDLSDASELKVDVYSPDDFPSNMTLALSTGDKWAWQEYVTAKIRKGWNRDVTFYFKDRKWKNEKSNWANTINPENINNARKICLVMFPANMGRGYVVFDNVRIKTKDPGKLAAILPFDMNGLAFYHWNSFEKGVNWQTQSGESGALAAQPAFDVGGRGKKGMELVFSTQSSVDKAVYMYRGREDFSKSSGIKFDIYNPMPYSVKISMAYQVGDEETWIESKQVGIGPGWNRDVFYDFISPSFKSAESNWNYSEYFMRRDDIRTVLIQVYPDQKVNGSIFVTDMMLARRNFFGAVGNFIGATFANNSKARFEAIKYAQWDDGSFEADSALTLWGLNPDPEWGKCRISLSEKYASKGKKSLKIEYKDTGNKFGIRYTNGGVLDLSQYTSMTFDLFNPGPPMKFTLVFKTGPTGVWNETNEQYILNPGWNRNITVKFDENVWKQGAGSGAMPLTAKNDVREMIMAFFKGFEGALYLDNIRWGTKSQVRITDGAVEQDINIEITPFEAMEAKVTLRGGYYHEQNLDLTVNSAHLILRGFGNELGFYSGETIKVFDDVFGMIDPGATGDNMMGITLGGTVHPINTSYLLSGLSLDSAEPWRLGTSFIGTARVKTYFLDKNYVGALFLNYRRGYDANANIITGDLEQSAYVYGVDTAFQLPVFGIVDLNIKGELLMSSYSTLAPVYQIGVWTDPDFVFATQSIPGNEGTMLKYAEVSARAGYLTAYGFFRQIDNAFAASFCDPDQRAGMTNADAKLTYIVDDLPPFSIIKNLSPDLAAFVRNTQLMAECDIGYSTSDDYSRNTYTIDLKNDESLAFSNYHIWYKYNEEGNVTKTISNLVTGYTKILLFDMLTFRILGRINSTQGTVLNGSVYETLPYIQYTGFIEGSLKLGRDFTLTGSYKGQRNEFGAHNNWYAKAEYNLFGAMSFGCSYGAPPLTGYWLDDDSNDTQEVYMVTFKGRF